MTDPFARGMEAAALVMEEHGLPWLGNAIRRYRDDPEKRARLERGAATLRVPETE